MTTLMKHIMVTGAAGQIGTELLKVLRKKHGGDNVLATDIQTSRTRELRESGPFEFCDVTQAGAHRGHRPRPRHRHDLSPGRHPLRDRRKESRISPGTSISTGRTTSSKRPASTELARVFIPSSIAAFGPETPRDRHAAGDHPPAEDDVRRDQGRRRAPGRLLRPAFGVDVRGCRFPGIISHETLPGGGTTDYAVAIFYEAVKNGRYTCFLREDTRLPMMYMPDCLKSVLDLMDADFARLSHHADFNLAAMSFTPAELAAEIRKHIPGLRLRLSSPISARPSPIPGRCRSTIPRPGKNGDGSRIMISRP